MMLRFTTADGEILGDVRLVDGELVGSVHLVAVVHSRMRSTGAEASAVLRALDGWSNGYLSTRLTS